MSTPLFTRPPGYVGRGEHKAAIGRLLAAAAQLPQPRALYVRDEGGLGKTRLLDLAPHIIEHESGLPDTILRRLLIAEPIDFYSYENRRPIAIEQHLIDGLTAADSGQAFRAPRADIDRWFAAYDEARAQYVRAEATNSLREMEATRANLREAFVAGWRAMTNEHVVVIRFDTLETLFTPPAPPEALVRTREFVSGGARVLRWLLETLPRLAHTFAILCGRPAEGDQQLIDRLRAAGVLDQAAGMPLGAFDDIEGIRAYLLATQVPEATLAAQPLDRIWRLTEGRPLLLTCYAEALRPGEHLGVPGPDEIASRPEYEQWLADTLLNPLPDQPAGQRTRMSAGDAPDDPAAAESGQPTGQRTLMTSLYFLVFARRGLRPDQIRELFEAHGNTTYDPAIVRTLGSRALVKASGGRLFLHDEIFAMIDASRHPQNQGLRDVTLAYLCDTSARLVQSVTHRSEVVAPMADHVYYELVRGFTAGYRVYASYAERLLNERNHVGVLVLSDVFWDTLRRQYPHRMAAGDAEYQAILRDELVRRVKLLRIGGFVPEALAAAGAAYERCYAEGVFPPEDAAPAREHTPQDPNLYVDLGLVRGLVIGEARPRDFEQRIERIYANIIALLDDVHATGRACPPLSPNLEYYRGQVFVLRGFLRRQGQRFSEATRDAEAGRRAFQRYRDSIAAQPATAGAIPYERVVSDLAQTTNNLAYLYALSGDFKRAERLSNEALRNAAALPPIRRAMFFNTRGLIYMRAGLFEKADAPIEAAEQAVALTDDWRAHGMVLQARAQRERERMKNSGRPRPDIGEMYAQARKHFGSDNSLLFELYYEWIGFARDLGALYEDRSVNQPDKAAQAYTRALALCVAARRAGRGLSPMLIADLRERMATIHLEMRQYAKAQRLLENAEKRMSHDMPEYGQIVSGKLELQWGQIHQYHTLDYRAALRRYTVALARAHAYADTSRDLRTFEFLVRRWLEAMQELAPHNLAEFKAGLSGGAVAVSLDELPYQKKMPYQRDLAPAQDDPAHQREQSARHWERAWERAAAWMTEEIAILQETWDPPRWDSPSDAP